MHEGVITSVHSQWDVLKACSFMPALYYLERQRDLVQDTNNGWNWRNITRQSFVQSKVLKIFLVFIPLSILKTSQKKNIYTIVTLRQSESFVQYDYQAIGWPSGIAFSLKLRISIMMYSLEINLQQKK